MMMLVDAMRGLMVPRLLQACVASAPEKPFLHFDDRLWTYAASREGGPSPRPLQ